MTMWGEPLKSDCIWCISFSTFISSLLLNSILTGAPNVPIRDPFFWT
jgi:hypothetical protein